MTLFRRECQGVIESGTAMDMLALDMILPRGDGPEIADAMRKRRPDLPVIYVSGFSRSHLDMAASISEDEFIEKPFSFEDVSAKLRVCLQSNS